MKKHLGWAIVALGLLITAVFAEVLVCPKCGYENPPGARVCVHCGAELPQAQGAAAEPAREDSGASVYTLLPTGKLAFLKPGVVEEEIELGKAYSATGEVDVARLFFHNAIALDMLTDPALTNNRAARVVDLLKKLDRPEGNRPRPCPACGGTGKSMMRVVSLNGDVSYQEVYGKPCPRCGGTGVVTGPASMDERRFAAGRAASRYTFLQQSRKYVPVGGAWVPMAIEQILSTRQVVLLRRSVPPVCPTCMGLGRVDCPKCHGTGEIKCPNPKCVHGMVQVDVTANLTKTKMTRTEKCPVCGGRGVIACPECQGGGSVVCKDCGGSGQLPLCAKCGGEGFLPCPRCHGTGHDKNGALCAACGGEGIIVCPACNGDGRKK